MRRLPDDATGGGRLRVVPLSGVARIRHVDICWFLSHAMFLFARGNCGLSWPTTFLSGSKLKKNAKLNPNQFGRSGLI